MEPVRGSNPACALSFTCQSCSPRDSSWNGQNIEQPRFYTSKRGYSCPESAISFYRKSRPSGENALILGWARLIYEYILIKCIWRCICLFIIRGRCVRTAYRGEGRCQKLEIFCVRTLWMAALLFSFLNTSLARRT